MSVPDDTYTDEEQPKEEEQQQQQQQTQGSSPTAAAPVQPVLARALYTYIGEAADELDFRKDDILEILSDVGQVWWFARRQRGDRTGYVPCNYVLLASGEVTGLSAWFELNRTEAEKLLLLQGRQPGTYLLRPSSTGYYALSVRLHSRTQKQYYFVKHFKITVMSTGGYYVTPGVTFSTMDSLLSHYHEHSDGSMCKLVCPCPREYVPPSDLSDLELNRECVTLHDSTLGNGSFSDVRLGLWNKSLPVAVKMLKPSYKHADGFIREARLLLRASHPNVVQIMGVCTTDEPMYIITELMVCGSLVDYLHKDSGVMLNIEHLVDMMAQVAEAMCHVHSLGIIHRDLRAANVLVGYSNRVKVADFGLARELDDSLVYTSSHLGSKFPAKWTPTEAAIKGRFTTKSDVWSFGVLMWEIVTYGGLPYSGLANREVMEFISRGYRMPNPHGGHIYCDQSVYSIMLECWSAAADHRPGFSQLKEHLSAYVAVYTAATH